MDSTPRAGQKRQEAGERPGFGTSNRAARVTPQLVVGVVLVAVWWTIDWLHLRPVSDYYFFPLWLGYILTVDGLVNWRTGSSLWRRSHRKFLLLFLISIPFWWLFEWLNGFLQNWHYTTPRPMERWEYFLVASIAFSTVVPAVLETAELLSSFRIGERLPQLPPWNVDRGTAIGLFLLGWVMLVLVIAAPRYAFPLTWISVFFILEPINVLLGQRSIGAFVRHGNWAAVWNVMLAALVCGFFWEMWNSYSMPKWTYSMPFVEFGHVFEMPILGYGGYLPFGLEIFAAYGLVFWLVQGHPQEYARVSAPQLLDKS